MQYFEPSYQSLIPFFLKTSPDLKSASFVRFLGYLLLLSFSAVVAAETENQKSYVLGVGDEIKISVHDEGDLLVQSRLNDSNVISYPFLGEIRPVGMTISQLEKRIIEGLKPDYILYPQVSVNVVRYRDFYINGEVRRPGGIPYSPGLTVRRAVSLAGGFTDRASTNKMYVVRERAPEQAQVRVNLETPIGPGDTLIIQEGLF